MDRDEYIFRVPSVREKEAAPARMRAEAIAMRRIVVEMGMWLSPLLRDHPLPVLTEWERTVDLSTLDHNHMSREAKLRRSTQQQRKGGATGANATRKTEYRIETYAEHQARKAEENRRRSKRRNGPKLDPKETIEIATPVAASKADALARIASVAEQKAADAARIEAQRNAAAQAKREAEEAAKRLTREQRDAERKRIAAERIAAFIARKAAERAAKELTPEQKAERRRETCRRAQEAYTARVKADPAKKAAFDERKRQRSAEQSAKRKAERHAAKQVTGAQTRIPNPHRDPTLPTAKQLREEAQRAAEIESVTHRSAIRSGSNDR